MIARGTVFLLVLSMSFLSAPTLHDFGGASINVYDVLLLWCLGVAGVIVCMTGRVKVSMGASIVPLLIHYALLVVLPVVGFIVYQYDIGNVTSSIRFAFIVSSISALWLMVAGKEEPVMRALMCALFIGLLGNFSLASLQHAEFFGMIQGEYLPHYWYEDMVENPKFNNPGRAVGFFSGPNQLGWFGVVGALLFMGRIIAYREKSWSDITIFAVSVAIVILSTSRSAFISLAVSAITVTALSYAAKQRVGRITFIAICISGASVYGLLASGIGGYVVRGLTAVAHMDLASDGSFAARSQYAWQNAIQAFESYPLGYGGDPVSIAGTIDSGWLSYLVQGSMMLVTSFLLLIVSGVYRSFQILIHSDKVERRWMAIACMGLSVSVALGSVVLSPFHYLHVMVPFIIMYLTVAQKESII